MHCPWQQYIEGGGRGFEKGSARKREKMRRKERKEE
jgi:hypothetical protein